MSSAENPPQDAADATGSFLTRSSGYAARPATAPHDYANDRGDWHDGDYGVFYNLDMEIPPPGKKPSAESRWGISHVAPRPAVAALSAASWYLDGYRPVACLDGLGGTALGYAYALVSPPSRAEGKERGGRRNAEAERNASRDVGSRAEPQNGKVSRPSPTTDAEPGTLPLRSAETPRFNNSAGEPPTPPVVLALWDYGTGCEVEISVGREEIVVADIMGEERIVPAPGGVLRLALGESPQYIMNATQVLRSSILAIALCTATMSLAETQTTKTSGDLSDPSFWPNGVIPSDRALLSPSAPANYTISRNVTFAGIRQDVNDVTIDASAGNPIVTMTAPIRISKQREQVPHSRRRDRHGDRNILHQASTAENHTLADAWQSGGTVPCLGAGNCERRHASRSGGPLHPLRKARPYRF